MAGKCEHGLTTRECMACASPKYGAQPDEADKWVTIPRARLAELESMSADVARLDRFEDWLADRAGPLLHIDQIKEVLK